LLVLRVLLLAFLKNGRLGLLRGAWHLMLEKKD